jgi:tRNA A37 threonylcarbamoyladenosine synthetase subunit TsaC/SUA5/YrdC
LEAHLPVKLLFVDRSADTATAARSLAAGGIVATAFGNFYAIAADPSAASVRRVNLAKGRPAAQVGSITTAAADMFAMFDWADVPRGPVRAVLSALAQAGPIGFRGPAAVHLPAHLTQWDSGVRTTQVITPGVTCPSNAFFARATAEIGADHLYVTSANRSRHQTGAREEPAHWTAAGIFDDFAHLSNLTVLAHPDEAAARAAYPRHLPMSVTVLSFHRALTVERHGSLDFEEVRRIAGSYGLAVGLGPRAQARLPQRSYAAFG